jgi:hypothetical protein
MSSDRRDVITPRDAAFGSTDHVPDERLPMLAAGWLAEGWSSETLVELASMSQAEARAGARRLLPDVLASLGVAEPYSRQGEARSRYTALIAWAVREMDGRFVPYSAGQKVLEVVDDDPQTFDDMPGAEELRARLRDVEKASSAQRIAAQAAVRAMLLDVAERLGVAR